jgi:hypothetical protein
MLILLDNIAKFWLRCRTKWAIDHNPEFEQYKLDLEKVEITAQGIDIILNSPAIAIIAEQAAGLLERNNSKNYFQFDCFPHAGGNVKPVRITVQWVEGMSPAQKNAQLCAELKKFDPENELLL